MNNETTTLKIAVYIRVSTDRQAKNNLSLEDQFNTIKNWANMNNAEIVKVYEDPGYSAFKGTRPEFEHMLSDVKKGHLRVDYIVTYDLSRFTRRELTRIQTEQTLAQAGIRLMTVIDGIPEDEDSAFIVKGIHGIFNEQYSRSLSKKSSIKLNQTASDGFHTGARPPFGYMSIEVEYGTSAKKRKRLEVNTEEAEIVRKIFRLGTTGKNGLRYGTKLIATDLNESFLLKRGKKWSPNDIHRILTDTIYFGERVFGKKRLRPDINREPVITKVPPIIDKEVFIEASKHLKKNAPAKKNHQAMIAPSLLTGLAKCHYCNCNFVVNTGKSGRYKYYKCRNKIKHSTNACKNKQINKEKLEKAVINELKENLFIDSALNRILSELKDDVSKYVKSLQAELLNANKNKSTLEQKRYKLVDNIASGKLEASEFINKNLKDYEDQIRLYDSEIKSVKIKMSLPIKRFGMKQQEMFLQACQNVLTGGNEEATKALLLSIVDKIDISNESVKIVGKQLKLLANVSSYDTCR